MIRSIVFLFLCALPVSAQTIKEQTQRNLMAMTNISATQLVNGDRYRVAMFGNRQVFNREISFPRQGIKPGDEWYTLLQSSQLWKLSPQGDHYTYSDTCRWTERRRSLWSADSDWDGLVPCDGEVYVDGPNITRITQRLHPDHRRLVKTAFFDITYEFVDLKDKRLLPTHMTMSAEFRNGRNYSLDIKWIDYKEFGAEVVLKEIDPDESPRPMHNGVNFFNQEIPDKATSSDDVTPPPDFTSPRPSSSDVVSNPSGLRDATTSSESVRSWKTFFKRLVPIRTR